MKKFFNIHNSIFNTEDVVAVHQQKRKIEVEKTVAVVRVKEGGETVDHLVYLPEGKQVSDYVDSERLNFITNQ